MNKFTATRIMLVNPVRLSDFYFTKDAIQLAKDLIENGDYTDMGTLSVEQEGESAAEEMFDLTNNPSRQEERMRLYGNHRSISVGDIVGVNGKSFLCTAIGWETL